VKKTRQRRKAANIVRHRKAKAVVVPTVEAVEQGIGMKAKKWAGRCHEVACKVLKARLAYGTERYGHYYGPVATGYSRHGLPFQRHGWIEALDGTVIDPTRWVFEGVEPYIYHGPADDYDAGGERVAAGMLRPYPKAPDPAADLSEAQREMLRRPIPLDLPAGPARERLAELTDGQVADFTLDQVFWMANLPVSSWRGHARAIYEAIAEAGQKALIPYDNWRMAMDEPMAAHRP
jgi:hypothetical protein